ncbi:hypothetical protein KEG38_34445 [Polyangium jinanense]|uniref:hypothetical protein n=1 Tax=Polyangium jinanense TaxID=2829994 RepID=UPI0023404ECF|nr:hypothetical protein [Polyangium jinanense]MDC3959006.1 hypothetical protein [Polyangium jinanense]
MKRVVLIVTGKTEVALDQSLAQLFPKEKVTFVVRPPKDSFTSNALLETPLRGTEEKPTAAEKLAQALVSEVDPGRRDEPPPDYVVLVDDLELDNLPWPERAIHYVRTALETHVERHYPGQSARERALGRVRDRCSFHLLSPMVEAYFLAEPAALTRAGATRASTFDATTNNTESSFQVSDREFLAPPNHKNKHALPPWASADRARHPKRYVQFLCDPTGTKAQAYKETGGGRNALSKLDWPAVLATSTHAQFVRSLIHDLADALEEPAVAQRFAGATHPLTWPPRKGHLLRNV